MVGRGSAKMVKADIAVEIGVEAWGVTAASAQSRQLRAMSCSDQENFKPADCRAATVRAKSPLLVTSKESMSAQGKLPNRLKTLANLLKMKSAALSALVIVGRLGASKMVRCPEPEA